MTFSEKLAFLMKLTDVSNKQLATALAVDPSLISRMRTGSRGAPRSGDFSKRAGLYFAKRCTGETQLALLAGALDKHGLCADVGKNELAALISDWLTADGRSSRGVRHGGPAEVAEQLTSAIARPIKGISAGYAFYGNAGKRAGIRTLAEHLAGLARPTEVLVSSDESQRWILEEPAFGRELSQTITRLRERGFTARRITPPSRSVDQALGTLTRWLDAEMAEQTTTFYYPRLRDDVFRRTLIVAPGAAALVSTSIVGAEEGGAVMLTFDPRLVASLEGEFSDYLAKCRRATTVFAGAEAEDRQVECAARFESYMADTAQCSNSLSSITTPPALLFSDGESDARLLRYQTAQAQFERNLQEHACIDLIRLATPEAVAAGEAVITAQYLLRGEKLSYTPAGYRRHLARILELAARYESYTPIPRKTEIPFGAAIQVKQGLCAELVRTQPSFCIFEVIEPNIVAACQEYLMSIAEAAAPPAVRRRQALCEIEQLLTQLPE